MSNAQRIAELMETERSKPTLAIARFREILDMAENLHVADAREILRLKRELAKYTQISGRLLWEWHHDSSPRGDGLVEQIEELYEHVLANGGTLQEPDR